MKKKQLIVAVTVLVIGSGVFLGVSTTLAQNTPGTSSVEQLHAQLAALRAQIATLQEQLVVAREIHGSISDTRKEIKDSYKLIRQLHKGMNGEDVRVLQELLASNPDLYPEGLVTGYYGALTEKAVKRLQKKYDLEDVGEVGPKTRKILNAFFEEKEHTNNYGKQDIKLYLSKKPFQISSHVTSTSTASTTDAGDRGHGFGREKVNVCHISGKKGKGKTLTIGASALSAHLKHGDNVGRCDSDQDNDDDNNDEDDDNDSADTIAPIMSSLTAVKTGTTTASVTWTTNEASDSSVRWSDTASLDPFASTTMSVLNGGMVTNHSIELTGLLASSTYFYIAISKDASENTATSTEQSFIMP